MRLRLRTQSITLPVRTANNYTLDQALVNFAFFVVHHRTPHCLQSTDLQGCPKATQALWPQDSTTLKPPAPLTLLTTFLRMSNILIIPAGKPPRPKLSGPGVRVVVLVDLLGSRLRACQVGGLAHGVLKFHGGYNPVPLQVPQTHGIALPFF